MDCPIVKQVTEAFLVFDLERKETVDVREVGTIIRSLGCYPSESELQHLVSEMEGEGTTPLVTLQKFVPPVCGILQQKRFQSASEDLILSAFQVMDTEKKGYLVRKELESALTSCGEPFSTDEMEEMWKAIQSLKLDRGGDRLTPADGFDYTTFTKFMMK